MIQELELVRGGRAVVHQCDTERVGLELTFPSPPGSSVELRVAGAIASAKVRGCRRVEASDPPRFIVEARWVNLSRAQKAALSAE